jgi:hypothetical protein
VSLKQKVWITKYALTTGVYMTHAEICKPGMIVVKNGVCSTQYFHGTDWHSTWESAEAQAYRMVDRAIKAAEKKLAKLQSLQFSDPSRTA